MGLSGKCDFEDTVSIYGVDNILNKYNVYASDNEIVPLKMESKKDLVAYYPYLVGLMTSDKETGGIIRLSKESYIDTEEKERFGWKLESLKRYWRSCKRNKVPFSKDEAAKKIVFFGDGKPEPHEQELIDRVAEHGEKATAEDLHDPWYDRMRGEWYQLMLDAGWGEDQAYRWVYGWKRWFDRIRNSADEFGDGTIQQKLDLGETDDSNSES